MTPGLHEGEIMGFEFKGDKKELLAAAALGGVATIPVWEWVIQPVGRWLWSKVKSATKKEEVKPVEQAAPVKTEEAPKTEEVKAAV